MYNITKYTPINLELFAKAIHNNFKYLSAFPELQHTVPDIIYTLKNSSCFVVRDNNNIIAYIIFETKNLNDGRAVCYISYIYVSEKYRSHGIGTKLLKYAIGICKHKYITLTCDTFDKKVIDYYSKFGFVEDQFLKSFNRHRVYTLFL